MATRSTSRIFNALGEFVGETVAVEGLREAAELLARDEQRLDARPEGDVESATAPVRRRRARPSSPARIMASRMVPVPDTRTQSRTSSNLYSALTISPIFWPASVGFKQTCTPAAASASIFACAVPLEPEMMAPACPIFRPGGAVTPAM